MKSPIRRGLACIGLGVTLAACGTLSVNEEKQLGRQAQRQVRQDVTLLRDLVVVNYVRNLGERLVAEARPSPFEFRFYVVEDESLNAFAVPGGAIYVHTGLILASRSASELAGMIAHEIGHVTARHVAQQYRRSRNTGVGAQAATILIGAATGSSDAARGGQVLTGIAAQAYLSGFSREAEREADALAVETMVRTGVHPEGLITMFETLQGEGRGTRAPQFLISHPATKERIQNVRGRIAQLSLPDNLRHDDLGRLPIIQERIRLLIGTDLDIAVEPTGIPVRKTPRAQGISRHPSGAERRT